MIHIVPLIIKVNRAHLSLKLCLEIRGGNGLHVIVFDLYVWGMIMNHDLFDHSNLFATCTKYESVVYNKSIYNLCRSWLAFRHYCCRGLESSVPIACSTLLVMICVLQYPNCVTVKPSFLSIQESWCFLSHRRNSLWLDTSQCLELSPEMENKGWKRRRPSSRWWQYSRAATVQLYLPPEPLGIVDPMANRLSSSSSFYIDNTNT